MTRIVSLLPSATEMVFALGMGDALVGVSHECDFPKEARRKPKVVRNRLPEGLPSAEIDRRVAAMIGGGESIYELDVELLQSLKPDVILTQELCDVCAITGTDLSKALASIGLSPEIHTQTPKDIAGILEDIARLGEILNVRPRAASLVEGLRARLAELREKTEKLPKPRVYCMEWLDPPFAAGHWVPEQASAAGGIEALGTAGAPSRRISWDDVRRANPDGIVLMPCGFTAEKAAALSEELSRRPEWRELSAVRNHQVWSVDANAYFSRPGPRVVDGAELLAHLFHPETVAWQGDASAFAPLAKAVASQQAVKS